MNWLYYIAEANLYLGVFYLAYCLLLTKETYYQLTRAYLLFACVVSFILPVLQIGALKPVETMVATTVAYTLPQYDATPENTPTVKTAPLVVAHHLTVEDYLVYSYFIGAAIVFIILMIKLLVLFKLVSKAKRIAHDKHKLVYLQQTNVAFSFFNYLFIGAEAPGANTIIRHELVHIRQKHSVDIVFLELLKVISWFNPFIYLLQNSLKTVHEYIADEQTAAYEADTLTYSSFLVNNAYGAGGSSLTHSFFNYNLLKKRIIMLNQKRSGNLARLKYLVAVPVCVGLLCVSTLAFSKSYGWVDIDPAKPVDNTLMVKQAVKKKPVLPIPSFTNPGYEYLQHNVMKTVTYNPGENDKGSFVVIGFDVANNGKLANITIEKSGGKNYDAKALKAYTAFNMPVNDKPGHRKSVVIFYNGQSISEIDPIRLAPDCISSWVISGGPFTYTVKHTNKGFEYDEYSENIDNKFNTRVVVYDANGKYLYVSQNKATPGELSLLKNKYGYTFPPLPKSQVKFPPPAPQKPALRKKDKNGAYVSEGRLNNGAVPIQTVGPAGTKILFIVDGKNYEFTPEDLAKYNSKSLIYMSCDKMVVYLQGNKYAEKTWGKGYGKVAVLTGNASIRIVDEPFGDKDKTAVNIIPVQNKATISTISNDDLEEFSKYISRNVKYPTADRQDSIGGRVITLFAVDANGNLQYAKVIRTPSEAMGNEVMRVLKKWPKFSWFKPGVQYALPITYRLGNEDTYTVFSPKSRSTGSVDVYNPNSVDIQVDQPGSLSLSEVVIRGYVKNP